MTKSLDSAELYDPVTQGWTTTASLDTPRGGFSTTLLPNGKVLVAGGTSTQFIGAASSEAKLFDPTTETCASTGNLSTARVGHTAVLISKPLPISLLSLMDPMASRWSVWPPAYE
jgi:hypothetical protein